MQPHFGWVHLPDEVEKAVSMLHTPELKGAVLQPLVDYDLGNDVFDWEWEEKLLGKQLPVWDQGQIGSCVGHGSGRAAQSVMIVQCVLDNLEWVGAEVCRESVYALSRCEYGQSCDNQDGSVGAWAARALQEGGMLFYQKYPSVDLTGGYDVKRCKQWGARGLPDDLEPDAKVHIIKTATRVDSVDAAWAAIGSGYFVSICGSQSRTMQRKPNGWCPVIGNDWNHCQDLCGRCTVKGGKKAIVYRNSWGDYLGSSNNTVELESGRTVTLPPGCYLSTPEEVDRDLRQKDSFAYSAIQNLRPRRLTWRNW